MVMLVSYSTYILNSTTKKVKSNYTFDSQLCTGIRDGNLFYAVKFEKVNSRKCRAGNAI